MLLPSGVKSLFLSSLLLLTLPVVRLQAQEVELFPERAKRTLEAERSLPLFQSRGGTTLVAGLLTKRVKSFGLYKITPETFSQLAATRIKFTDKITVKDDTLRINGVAYILDAPEQRGQVSIYRKGLKSFKKIVLPELGRGGYYLLHVGAPRSGYIALINAAEAQSTVSKQEQLYHMFLLLNEDSKEDRLHDALFLLSTSIYDGLVTLSKARQYTHAGNVLEQLAVPIVYLQKIVSQNILHDQELHTSTQEILGMTLSFIELYTSTDVSPVQVRTFLRLFDLSLRDYFLLLKRQQTNQLNESQEKLLNQTIDDFRRERKQGGEQSRVQDLTALKKGADKEGAERSGHHAIAQGLTLGDSTVTSTPLPLFAGVNRSYQAPVVCNSPFISHPDEMNADLPGIFCHGGNIVNLNLGTFSIAYHSRASSGDANLWGFGGMTWVGSSVIDSGLKHVTEGFVRKQLKPLSSNTYGYLLPQWGDQIVFTKLDSRTIQARAAGSDIIYNYSQIWSSSNFHLKSIVTEGGEKQLEVSYFNDLSPSRISYRMNGSLYTDSVTYSPGLVTIASVEGWHKPILLQRDSSGKQLVRTETVSPTGQAIRSDLTYTPNDFGQTFLTAVITNTDDKKTDELYFGYDKRGVLLARGTPTINATFSHATNLSLGMITQNALSMNSTVAFRLTGSYGLVSYYTLAHGEIAFRYGLQAEGYPRNRLWDPQFGWFDITRTKLAGLTTTKIANSYLGAEERASSISDAGFKQTKIVYDKLGGVLEEQLAEYSSATDTLKTTYKFGQYVREFIDVAGNTTSETFLSGQKVASISSRSTDNELVLEDLMKGGSYSVQRSVGESFSRITRRISTPLGSVSHVREIVPSSGDIKVWTFDGNPESGSLIEYQERNADTASRRSPVLAPGRTDQWWFEKITLNEPRKRSSGFTIQPPLPQ